MSSKGLAVLAVERNQREPTRSAIGRASPDEEPSSATFFDTLTTVIPTGAIAGYTFLMTQIVAQVDDPNTDQLLFWRWLAFGFLVVGAGALLLVNYYTRPGQHTSRFPALELTATILAASIWGLSIPESPLIPLLTGDAKTLVPIFILVIGASLVSPAVVLLKKKAEPATEQHPSADETTNRHQP